MIIYAVDDEVVALDMLAETIAAVVPLAEIKTFSKASEVLKAARETAPDILFLDIEMPGMTGVELAKAMQEIKPDVNIIFVTGYSSYLVDAMDMFASGYVMKPVEEKKIQEQMNHLRYPVDGKKSVRIKTFGNFDIFMNDTPVKFRSPKSKELLAYLVDREGAFVSRKEAAGILYEDEYTRNVQRELSRNGSWLVQDLKKVGIVELVRNDNGYSIDLSKVDCDLVSFLNGDQSILYLGEYMEQYSWGEYRKGVLSGEK